MTQRSDGSRADAERPGAARERAKRPEARVADAGTVETVRALVAAGTRAKTAAAQRAEDLLALIARRKARIAEDFYEIGLALRELVKRKLYDAVGCSSFAELLATRKVMSVRTAEKLIDVVERVPRARALELGQEKAYALARLVAATPELDSVDSVIDQGIPVGGKRRPVTEASTRDIEAATRAARKAGHAPSAHEQAAARAAKALQAATRKAGARGAVATVVHAGGGFEVALRVKAAAAAALAKALG